VITYEDGEVHTLKAADLRQESPSAENKPRARRMKRQTMPDHVYVTNIQAVGNYAVRLTFSDGHQTGLYTWETLHRLGTAAPAPDKAAKS